MGVLVLLASACGVWAGEPEVRTVEGILLEIDAVGNSRLEGFTLRTDEGALMQFSTAEDFMQRSSHPMSPGHLRQHMALADRLSVTYRREGERLIALSASDEP